MTRIESEHMFIVDRLPLVKQVRDAARKEHPAVKPVREASRMSFPELRGARLVAERLTVEQADNWSRC